MDSDDLAGTCLSVSWLRDKLAALPCRHCLLVLDSCYSGSLFQTTQVSGNARPDALSVVAEGTSRGTTSSTVGGELQETLVGTRGNLGYYLSRSAFLGMSAGRLTPVADGLGENRHSVFTRAFLEVLRLRANSPRDDKAFTFRELAGQVESRTRSARGSRQIPN